MTVFTPIGDSTDSDHEPPGLVKRHYELSGRFIEKCAEAEGYLLTLVGEGDVAGVKPRAPLSCKLAALRDLATSHPDDGARKKLCSLLDGLEPLADLRTELAHSTSCTGRLDGQWVIFLKNAGERHAVIDRRVVLAPDDLQTAHRQLSDLVNQLRQLVGKSRVNPPAPLPAKQQEASGSKSAPSPRAGPAAT